MDVDSFRNLVPIFVNRSDAGWRLAKALRRYRAMPDTVIAGIPRGGVLTAAVVAEELMLPIEVVAIRRLEVFGHRELVMGAIGPGDVCILVDDVVRALHISKSAIELEIHRQSMELRRQERLYRANRLPLDFAGKTAIVVDDGIGSGATMDAALAVIRRHHAARIVVAVPVAPPLEAARLREDVDEFVSIDAPGPFFGIGYWYREFPAVHERDVLRALERAEHFASRYAWQEKGAVDEHVHQTR